MRLTEDYRRSPYLKKVSLTTRQLLHEGREWLVSHRVGLPDIHSYEDIAKMIETAYPGGLNRLKYDLEHVMADTYMEEYNRCHP